MSQRDQIRMSEREVADYLAQGRSLAVATINPDGAPHLVAMWYALVDGKIAFWTYAKSQKAVNLRRDPRLTCMMESGANYAELRGVQISGRATLVEDPAQVRALGEAIYRRNSSVAGALTPQQTQTIDKQAPKRIGVIVEPISIASWDHSKLGGAH
ncbi:MAG TPA: TIGR03618 family F420-dependent PPOX class oxidoreductase [Ktedonobacterales bacterium]|jgi:PPOX class probable F420-dependent enzyme|nr:TIGR03618 family F420-dependent PPOX class oxidoreductase [Ktedonobacterales bacterium]